MGAYKLEKLLGRAMPQVTAPSQSDHDWMVEQMVEAYSGLGHDDIRATHVLRHNGEPERLGLYVPDVTAMAGVTQIPIICEVETADSMRNEQAHSRFMTLRYAADSVGGVLHVGVPFKSDLNAVKRLAASWGVLVDQWWYGVAL
jgi:hypothetical protein